VRHTFIKRKNVRLQYTYDNKYRCIQLQLEGPIGFSNSQNISGITTRPINEYSVLFCTKSVYKTFLSNFQSWYVGVVQGYYIPIRLAGVGFKGRIRDRIVTTYLCTTTFHFIRANSTLTARYRKYKVVLFGTDKHDICSVARVWQRVGIPDTYTGVGIRIIGETVYVKPGKQRI